MKKAEGAAVPLSMKFGYGAGDFGANLVFQMVNIYLMIFFTDVFGIEPAVAGIIFFVSKVWDGVNDPVMGYVSDRTRTRWGSKRPWLLFGALPLAASFIMLFSAPDMSPALKPWYGLLAFVLVCTAYTVVNVPYGALTAAMTLDTEERSTITGFRMFFAIVATLFIGGAVKPMVAFFASLNEGNTVMGWRYTVAILAGAAALFTMITFVTVRERVKGAGEERFSIRDIVKTITGNKPFLFLSFGTVAHLTAVILLTNMVNYFFTYIVKKESFIPVALTAILVPAVLALPLWVMVGNRKGKKFVFNGGMTLVGLSLVALFFVRHLDAWYLLPLLVVAGIGTSTIYLSPWAMVPDTVEYAEVRTGMRREGVLYGFFYFGQKLSAAFAFLISGIGLQLAGYLKAETLEGVSVARDQGGDALMGISVLTSFVPTVLIVVGIFLISRYSITESSHREMVATLKKDVSL